MDEEERIEEGCRLEPKDVRRQAVVTEIWQHEANVSDPRIFCAVTQAKETYY